MTKTNTPLTRRKFVAISATAGASVTLGGCIPSMEESAESLIAEKSQADPALVPMQESASDPVFEDGFFPRHEPYGSGVGAMPGRVAWVRDESAVNWDGSGYWWQAEHFDAHAVRRMMNDAVTALGGDASAPSQAWDAIFREHNVRRGRSGGYRPGQKVAIKCNMNGAGTYGRDEDSNLSFTAPVVLRALLLSLVEDAGVAPEDITAFDACRIFPQHMIDMCTEGPLAGVRFRHYHPDSADDAELDESAPIVWSQPVDGAQNYLPQCVSEADYLVNVASLKGHEYGFTMCGKNHFGTIMNDNRLRPPEAAGIHRYLTNRAMGAYTVLADLAANALIGGKTVLNILDALLVAPNNMVDVAREDTLWENAPFNGGYTASIFASQDPLAIDSVGADFLTSEPAVMSRNAVLSSNPACENYLHEAALVSAAPSGVTYLDGAGSPIGNLGVHEHWNNPVDRRYSRNRGAAEGIELVQILR